MRFVFAVSCDIKTDAIKIKYFIKNYLCEKGESLNVLLIKMNAIISILNTVFFDPLSFMKKLLRNNHNTVNIGYKDHG